MKARSRNITLLHRDRENKARIQQSFPRLLHVTDSFVDRLSLDQELDGHQGCVNCLEWNETGTLLASGSDDVQVVLWDPFRYKKVHSFHTGHHGNIFSVKFLPNSSDNTLVSGAADSRIRVHDIPNQETIRVCSCHTGRVKRLATAPNIPYMYWSAAEDGTVMQFDLRVPHTCSSDEDCVLINLLNHTGRTAEAKCIAINPIRPELLAVGANDPYVRLYDRRMIRLSSLPTPEVPSVPRNRWETTCINTSEEEDNIPPGCVQYFVAGHLPKKYQDYRKHFRSLASTYLTFSSDGNELLVNLGGEQIYLFDINKQRKPKVLEIHKDSSSQIAKTSTNGYSNGLHANNSWIPQSSYSVSFPSISTSSCGRGTVISSSRIMLPLEAESLKIKANSAFEKEKFTPAINLYSKALLICPTSAILHGNRAAAYMKRRWDGDVYAALRDCHTALTLDPNHFKAHFRLARCLHDLQWTEEAQDCMKSFKIKFPDQADTRFYKALEKDIQHIHATINNGETTASDDKSDNKTSTSRKHRSHHKLPISEKEQNWRRFALDYEARFCGHCNTTTDIKEANFFGSEGQYIVAGSDDGSFFIWDRHSTNIVRILHGDDSIVNCLQAHPFYCLLATSGIDTVVRLWTPCPEDGVANDREVQDLEYAASANQKRMNADPFEVMLLTMGYPLPGPQGNSEDSGDDVPREPPSMQCHPS